MPNSGEVLIAIINNRPDFEIARNRHWYRIPVTSAEKWLKDRWPPRWLAFYQTKVFAEEAFAVNYYARVLDINQASRQELFPHEPESEKSSRRYYQLILEPLKRLPKPVLSRRWRRIVFIPTTWEKLRSAAEINDLYDEGPLEDRLWAELKRLEVSAERQEFVQVKGRDYALDFAIYCTSGKLDVETDGDTWHGDPKRIPLDNLRDNDLETAAWKLLRFNGQQIREEMEEYCLPTIAENINNLGGVDEGRVLPRRIRLDAPGTYQLGLFDV